MASPPDERRIRMARRLKAFNRAGCDPFRVMLIVDDPVPAAALRLLPATIVRGLRPHRRTGGPSPSGLGLAISHKIIADHGGELSVVPQTERGAHFVIRLPASLINEQLPQETSLQGATA